MKNSLSRNRLTPGQWFGCCKGVGLGLLFAFWVKSGDTAGFLLLLFLVVMALLRWRMPKWRATVLVDFAVMALLLSVTGTIPIVILALPLFEAMYLGFYWSALSLVYGVYLLFPNTNPYPPLLFTQNQFEPIYFAVWVLGAVSGFWLNAWARERWHKQYLRDTEAGRYYELARLQNDMVAALARIEQMTTVAERARIARDIHDNAGHEIVAASMAFQSLRPLLPPDNTDMLQLYDTALARLFSGTDKIREAVHNLAAIKAPGVESLREKCRHFTPCAVDCKVYGDTSRIPIYVWSMLESCLSEALTNIARHSSATWVTVMIDATPHIIRLCVANDGVGQSGKPSSPGSSFSPGNPSPPGSSFSPGNPSSLGNGLRNLRHRAAAIGGSLSVDAGAIFNVICVIPIRKPLS